MLRCCALLFVLSIVRSDSNPYCYIPCEYGDKFLNHTVCERQDVKCKFSPTCGPEAKVIKFDTGDRQFLIDMHNELRNKVASGNEIRGSQPPASDMKILRYNRELEFIAQCWSNNCNPRQHDACRRTNYFPHVGQNIAFMNSSVPIVDIKNALREMIMVWYNEVEMFKSDWINDTQNRGPNYKIGHYTQLMWAQTNELGCALTYYTSIVNSEKYYYYLLICNYGPGGNYLGMPVYSVGPPCNTCEENCNPDFNALCGRTPNVVEDVKFFVPFFDV